MIKGILDDPNLNQALGQLPYDVGATSEETLTSAPGMFGTITPKNRRTARVALTVPSLPAAVPH
jgi:hypothetical protein